MPRAFETIDAFMGEAFGKYGEYEPFVMYVMTPEGYEGGGEFFTKFGLEIRDNIKLATLTSDWRKGGQRLIGTKRSRNSDGDWEESQIYIPKRPVEGDLIYIPTFGKAVFEITFVEDERPFYAHGELFLYELNCEKFVYSGEAFDLVPDDDADEKEIEDVETLDELDDDIQDRDQVIELIIPEEERETDEEKFNTEDQEYDFSEEDDIIVADDDDPFSASDVWVDDDISVV